MKNDRQPSPVIGSMPVLREAGFAAKLPVTPRNKGEKSGSSRSTDATFERGRAQAAAGNSQMPMRAHTTDPSFSSVETDASRYGQGNNVNPNAPNNGSIRGDHRRFPVTASYTRTATAKR